MERTTQTRQTRQRKLVLETLRNTKSHPTADWLFEQARQQLPSISLGTVYRNLNVLRDAGLIRELRVHGRTARWDADTSPHGHFICTECGEVQDVMDLKPYDWKGLKDLVGCQVVYQRCEFYGLCPRCQRLKEQPQGEDVHGDSSVTNTSGDLS